MKRSLLSQQEELTQRDYNKKIVLSIDALVLGAMLSQEGKPLYGTN